ncbi:MAG: hypothetical protein [Siphoviridae sp. ct7UA22]|nr:MAG: hypothetical protein [Siphoviridae sp. ct7UA22]
MKTLNKQTALIVMSAMQVSLAYGHAGSKFDPTNLLHTGLNTEEIPTERTLTPEGEHRFVIGKPRIESGEKDGKTWVKVNLPLDLDDAGILAELGVARLQSSYSFFLDLTDDNQIATGPNKNVKLGQTYQAAGLTGDEVTIAELEGRQVIGAVRHRLSEKSQTTYDEVTSLAAVE